VEEELIIALINKSSNLTKLLMKEGKRS